MSAPIQYQYPGGTYRPRRASSGVWNWDLSRLTLAAIVLLLTGAPLMRVVAGAIPIYIFDVMVIFGFSLMGMRIITRASLKVQTPLPQLITIYFLFIVTAWLREVTEIGLALEPFYVILRYATGVSLIVLLPSMIRTREDLNLVMKCVLVGTAFASGFAVLYALPPFGAVRTFLNQGSFLFPGRARADLDLLSQWGADRAMSPVGGPNVTANWSATFWPLGLMIWRTKLLSKKWNLFAAAVTFIGLGGVLLSYGRSALLSVVLVAFVIIGLRLFKAWLTTSMIVGLGVLFILTVGLVSEYFDFQLVFFKFERMINDPTAAHTDRARLASYSTLIPFLEKNPLWYVTGMGILDSKAVRLGVVGSASELVLHLQNGEVHSMFAAAFYHLGLSAMIILNVLVIWVGVRAGKMAMKRDGPYVYYWQYLFIAMISLIPFWLFEHIYMTEEQGNQFFFFLLALIITVGRLDPSFRSRRIVRRIPAGAYAAKYAAPRR